LSFKLAALTQNQLATWSYQARQAAASGQLPRYIPALADVNPEGLAVHVRLVQGTSFAVTYVNQRFPLMSVVKPLLLLFLLEQEGPEAVLATVGLHPSDQSFHSVAQLEADRGFPRNPMINSGAIALAARLPGHTGRDRCDALCHWLNQRAGCQLGLDEGVLASVRSLENETNAALAHRLVQAGRLSDVDTSLDTYNHICCLAGTVADLSRLGLLLAMPPRSPDPTVLPPHPTHQRLVNALMLTCGLYEASGQYAARIGLPMKSGVSGGLLAIVPGAGAIACYSPALDATGNSVAGLFLMEKLATELNLSLFTP
jgi:glutaminase